MSTEVGATYTDLFAHAFDEKGRITVPSEWRQPGFESSLFILRTGANRLRVYPASWMNKLHARIAQLDEGDPTRVVAENLAMDAQSATFDTQGRILVKPKWRDSAGLAVSTIAQLVGRMDRFEIWNKAAWDQQQITPLPVEEALVAMRRP